jgi:hypothetical protein
MQPVRGNRRLASLAIAIVMATVAAGPVLADHGAAHVVLESGTKGCTGVLPSGDGNTDMHLVGGTMWPGGTAIFEIAYPVNAASVGKEFTILDCAFINDVATLKYTVSFVPSNRSFRLTMTLAVPEDAPVGGMYCNYVKTTGSPTAAQASQRKAGPACFVIRPRPSPTAAPPATGTTTPPRSGTTTPPTTGTPPTSPGGTTRTTGGPLLLPDTAMPAPRVGASPARSDQRPIE